MPSKPKPKTTRKAKTTTKKTRARSYNVGGQVAPAKAERPEATDRFGNVVANPNARKASNAAAAKRANAAPARKANAAPQELINAFNASQRGNAGKSTFTPSQRQLQQAQAGIKGTVPKNRQQQQKMFDQQARRMQQQSLGQGQAISPQQQQIEQFRMQQQAGGGRQQQGKYGFANPQQEKRFGRMIEAQNVFENKLREKYKGQQNPQITPSEKRRLMSFSLSRARMDLQRPNLSDRQRDDLMNQIRMLQQEMSPVRGRGGTRTTGRPNTRPRPPAPPAIDPTRPPRNRPVGGRGVTQTTRPKPRPTTDPTRPPRNRPVRGRGGKPTTRPRPRPTPTRRTPRSRK